jgi:PiT family inorganic phosphate transporter
MVETMATNPSASVGGLVAQTGAAAMLALILFGWVLVSTTHTITGAIVGVSSLKRLSAVRGSWPTASSGHGF